MADGETGLVLPRALAGWLLASLTLAFASWAGVVWNMGSKALNELHSVRTEQSTQSARLSEIVRNQQAHEGAPWHDRAGEELREISAQQRIILAEIRRMASKNSGKHP